MMYEHDAMKQRRRGEKKIWKVADAVLRGSFSFIFISKMGDSMINKKIKQKLFTRERKHFRSGLFRCPICKEITAKVEIDHSHPLSRGGTNKLPNLNFICEKCNRKKRNLTPYEFSLRLIQKR